MKKVLSIVTMIFILASVNASTENLILGSSYVKSISGLKQISIETSKMSASIVKVRIYNQATNEVIYSDDLNTKGKNEKIYDLKKLTEGHYTIEVNDLMKVEQTHFEIIGDQLVLNDSKLIHKPVIWRQNDKFEYNLFTGGIKTTLQIFDDQGIELLNKSYKDQLTISEVLHIVPNSSETLTIKTTIGNKVFNRIFNM